MSFFEDKLRHVIEENRTTGADWCVTLESTVNPDNWIQFTAQHVNMHYPLGDDPVTALANLAWPQDGFDLEDWHANLYITFKHAGTNSITSVSTFVTQYTESVLRHEPSDGNWSIDEFELDVTADDSWRGNPIAIGSHDSQVDLCHHHTLTVTSTAQHDAPRIDNHRSAETDEPRSVLPELIRSNHEQLVFNRSGTQQHLPMIRPGGGSKRRRQHHDLSLPIDHLPKQLGKTQVVAGRLSYHTERCGSHHYLVAGLHEIGLTEADLSR